MGCTLLPGDAFVVGASEDGRLCYWELVDAQLLLSFQAHRGPVCSVAVPFMTVVLVHSRGRVGASVEDLFGSGPEEPLNCILDAWPFTEAEVGSLFSILVACGFVTKVSSMWNAISHISWIGMRLKANPLGCNRNHRFVAENDLREEHGAGPHH